MRTARCHLNRGSSEKHADRVELIFLRAYAPDLNPDGLLDNDLKANVLGVRRPATRLQMAGGFRSYLRSTQRRPDVCESVRYAA